MNQHPHDYALSLGPCPDYEFDLVELQEGSLEPGRAGAVQHHMAQCSRCRAYAQALGALDAALADALPRPALPCPALPSTALPSPALPSPPLPSPALPCPALPCPDLT